MEKPVSLSPEDVRDEKVKVRGGKGLEGEGRTGERGLIRGKGGNGTCDGEKGGRKMRVCLKVVLVFRVDGKWIGWGVVIFCWGR